MHSRVGHSKENSLYTHRLIKSLVDCDANHVSQVSNFSLFLDHFSINIQHPGSGFRGSLITEHETELVFDQSVTAFTIGGLKTRNPSITFANLSNCFSFKLVTQKISV